MTASHRLSLDIDQEAGAAYLQFSGEDVARSVEFDDYIVVDLDAHGVVVGVEILDLTRSIPLDDLTERFHIRTEAMAVLLQSLRSTTTSHHLGVPAPTTRNFGAVTAQPTTGVVASC